jgi:hypothetical protein
MSTDILAKKPKKNLLPEVKTERLINLDQAPFSWSGLLEELENGLNLQFIRQRGNNYRFKFPGNCFVNSFQILIFRGGSPDPEPYRELHSYLELRRLDERRINIKVFETMIGTRTEQQVFRQVLDERLEDVIAFIQNRQYV